MGAATQLQLKRSPAPNPPRSALKTSAVSIAVAILVGVVTLALFLPTLNNGFVNWDDDVNLINNPDFRGFSWEHLKWMWTNQLMSHYVPLTWMSFGLDYVLWKDSPFGYHLMNALLHAANAGIFFLLAVALFRRVFPRIELASEKYLLFGAAFAALFFSVHPLRVESVAWATERRDVLSGFFYLLALLVYVRAPLEGPARSMPRASYIRCLILFVLSILSKEIAVTLPLILLLLDVYPLRRLGIQSGWWTPAVRSVWLEKIPFFLISLADGMLAVYTGMRDHLLGSLGLLSWTARIAISVYDMAFYLLKTIVPVTLSPLYPLTRYKTSLAGMPFRLSAIAVVLVTVAFVALRKKYPGLLTAWIACAITLLPVGGFLHQGFQIAADRYTYLACLGWALVAGAGVILGLQWLSRSRAGITVLGSASVLLLFGLSYLCRKQIAVWHDSSALWSKALEVESSYPAHLNLGSAFMDEGDALGAMEQFRKAVALWPDNPLGHANLGKALFQLNRVDEAIREFQFSIRFDPNPSNFNSLGEALAKGGRWDEAVAALREAVRRNPVRKEYQANLDRILKSQPGN